MEQVRRGGRRAHRSAAAAGISALALVLAACGEDGGGTGAAEESGAEESYYAGETVDFVVPYEPGGGYDTYARALAPYLGECLDGARVVVQNEPGAGGLLAVNNTFTTSPDERRIQIVNTVGAVSAQIAGAEGVSYDMLEFGPVGRLGASPSAFGVAPDGEFEDFQDVIDAGEPIRFPTTGPGANDFITPNVLAAIYGFETDMISGYQGSGEARLALISGDGDAYVQSWDSMYDSIQSGEVEPILIASTDPVEELSDVPTLADYEPTTEEGTELRESLSALEATGRGIVAPPGLPEERLTELQEGFDCAVEDEEFLAEMEAQERPLEVLSGPEWQEVLDAALNSSDQFQSIITESFAS
jgi:tripartite-type tricarboxylate transporter receptor subunit TctC